MIRYPDSPYDFDPPDDVCYQCGHKFTADLEIEEGMPQWEGFCSHLCQTNNKLGIQSPCNGEMAEMLTNMLGRDDPEGWSKSVYKGTDCGAWLTVNCQSVTVGSIVEGSDVEIDPITLDWPFTESQFWAALEAIELEADFYWKRDNSTWFYVDFTPVDKPAQRFYGSECWGEFDWQDGTPAYVVNKVRDWFRKVNELPAYERKLGIALGVQITLYQSDSIY
jgi:hypothetical protein